MDLQQKFAHPLWIKNFQKAELNIYKKAKLKRLRGKKSSVTAAQTKKLGNRNFFCVPVAHKKNFRVLFHFRRFIFHCFFCEMCVNTYRSICLCFKKEIQIVSIYKRAGLFIEIIALNKNPS